MELRNPKTDKKTGLRPVSITARKLEALVRLAEASARVRLSNTVEVPDADRAIAIIKYFMDSNTSDSGVMDIDVLETGISSSSS